MSANEFTSFAIDAWRGDTIPFTCTVTRNGVAVNITGATFYVTGKTDLSVGDVSAQFQITNGANLVLTTPASGLITVTIPPSATSGLTAETLLYVDIQMKESNNQVSTVAAGTIRVKLDVTQTA